MKPNILFIMADQLRADYLGCMGHPTLRTPVIDALAAESVIFDRAFCQGPVCGPSRMSFYTGRYVINHGASYNEVPLGVQERTLGDYLRPLGYRVALVGKTHMKADYEGMRRLGVDPRSSRGVLISECGFEPYERDDGLHPDQLVDPDLPYNRWLRALGYDAANPWHDYANAAAGPGGELLSGWYLRNARHPARVREEHSETAYITDRAMQFVQEAGDTPWCLHLSYIKPHWPYIAPDPYHRLYSEQDVLPAVRDPAERNAEHPVVGAYRRHEESVNFSDERVRMTVIPTYMGLVGQLDHHLGRLFEFLKRNGQWENTLIVFTSDHGDYLGDHWLGEKDLFHDTASRIPLIVRDPRAAGGRREARLVEAIDLAPTFLEAAGGERMDHVLEGRSLLPLLRGGEDGVWREAVFSEADYACRPARRDLGVAPDAARAFMVRTQRWKYIHYTNFGAELFDLEQDPDELHDLGKDPDCRAPRDEMRARLFDWFAARRTRVNITNARIEGMGNPRARGIVFGAW